MTLDRDLLLNEVARLSGLHFELIGRDVAADMIGGTNQAMSLEGGSNIDVDGSYKVVLESFHFVILVASTILEGRRLIAEHLRPKESPDAALRQLLDSLETKFDQLDPDARRETIEELRGHLEQRGSH